MKKNKFFSRQEHILCGKEQIFAEGKFSSDVATATANRCLYLQKETFRFLEQHPTDVSIRSSDRYCQISNEMGLRLSPGKTVIPWRESQGGADDLFTVNQDATIGSGEYQAAAASDTAFPSQRGNLFQSTRN